MTINYHHTGLKNCRIDREINMERNKREAKQPEKYIIPTICYPRIRKKKHQKKRAVIQAQYQSIPFPLKFVYTQKVFAFYADLVLTEAHGSLIAETSALNKYVDYPEILVKTDKEYKIVSVDIQKRGDCVAPPWQYQVEKLLESDNPELKSWGHRLTTYCLKHEDLLRSFADGNKLFGSLKAEELTHLAQTAEFRVHKLFSKYPCLAFTTTFRPTHSKIERMVFNEKYISEIGYSIDSFVTMILQEGMPRVLPMNTSCSAKMLVESFYNFGGSITETPEIVSDLPLKKGFNKKIRYKICYIPEIRGDGYDLHGVVVILGKDDEVHKEASGQVVNKKFLKKMIQKEKEGNTFLQKFYDEEEESVTYSTINKVCQIKEISDYDPRFYQNTRNFM